MRHTFAPAAISALLLAGAIFLWPELFLFAKVFYPPDWTRALPSVLVAAPLVSLLCLLPVAIGIRLPSAVARSLLAPVLLSPLAAVAIYVSGRSEQSAEVLANAFFQYVWVAGFHLLLPAIAVFFSSLVVHHLKKHWPAQEGDA